MKNTVPPDANWDQYYRDKPLLRPPTNLGDYYPDCFGAIERIEDLKFERRIRWVSRVITLLIAVCMVMAALHFFDAA